MEAAAALLEAEWTRSREVTPVPPRTSQCASEEEVGDEGWGVPWRERWQSRDERA